MSKSTLNFEITIVKDLKLSKELPCISGCSWQQTEDHLALVRRQPGQQVCKPLVQTSHPVVGIRCARKIVSAHEAPRMIGWTATP